jgi:hypothetical protein
VEVERGEEASGVASTPFKATGTPAPAQPRRLPAQPDEKRLPAQPLLLLRDGTPAPGKLW